MKRSPVLSRHIGRFAADRQVVALLIVVSILIAGMAWLRDNPQHNPAAPLDLRHADGVASAAKWQALRDDVQICHEVMERSEVQFQVLDPEGEEACARPDRVSLVNSALSPSSPVATCAVNAAMASWLHRTVEPAALDIFGSPLVTVRHLGTYSCRRINGRSDGRWSQHATGNAIDIAGFVLADGTEISVVADWADISSAERKGRFLRHIRGGACQIFGTVLSPDYNAAHRDHFHLDQAPGNWGICR